MYFKKKIFVDISRISILNLADGLIRVFHARKPPFESNSFHQWNPIGLTPPPGILARSGGGDQTNGNGRDVDNCSLGAKNAPKQPILPKNERNCQNFRLRRPKLRFSERTQILRSLPEGGGQTYGIPLMGLNSDPRKFQKRILMGIWSVLYSELAIFRLFLQ